MDGGTTVQGTRKEPDFTMATRTGKGAAFLGKQVRGAAERLDLIEWKGSKTARHTLDCTEFTSLCPVTGQPDFGRLVIEYTPGTHIVETKSLKLWLRNWRERGVFNEVIVEEIADAFAKQVRPRSLIVRGAFNLRGGISVTAESRRARA